MEQVGLTAKGQKEALDLLENFREEFTKIAKESLSSLYTDVAQHIESDAWQNYRNELQWELGNEALTEIVNNNEYHWAKKVRARILEEHREALIGALNQDLVKEVASLKEEIKNIHVNRIY